MLIKSQTSYELVRWLENSLEDCSEQTTRVRKINLVLMKGFFLSLFLRSKRLECNRVIKAVAVFN